MTDSIAWKREPHLSYATCGLLTLMVRRSVAEPPTWQGDVTGVTHVTVEKEYRSRAKAEEALVVATQGLLRAWARDVGKLAPKKRTRR